MNNLQTDNYRQALSICQSRITNVRRLYNQTRRRIHQQPKRVQFFDFERRKIVDTVFVKWDKQLIEKNNE